MASSELSAAEAQWREQFAAMQEAIANLKIPNENGPVDGDADEDEFGGYSSGNSGQDVWDFISDDDQDAFSSDFADGEAAIDGSAVADYSAEWFAIKCSGIAAKNGLSADVFESQIMSVLSSSRSDDELQIQLTDLVGFDDLDFIIEVLGHRDEIVSAVNSQNQRSSTGPRLLNKSQREDALRRQDLAHKTATLAPAHSKEPHYPHVYKSYSAGNTLSYAGKKYGLPVGSERKQFDKYEEYSIPAGRKGVLGPGQRLIPIKELNGLCRNTFKGYKTLNRMQSLVYPVAHKTSENMLICAPTGAGKTDAAMLTILQTIAQNVEPNPFEDPAATEFFVNAEDFKIVYVAPMKALAAEVTEKLGKRLAWLGIKCREYTGDMQLTKAEIIQTQIIVTTP
ncbi:putative steryl acetyl hydrolase mug81 [Fusarium falciforme]|nr:putative steryl acetyl hydrolase mug81 [Fusarium falciforme]